MSKQPEALRLADELTIVHNGHADEGPSTFSEAADELRRLHSLNVELLEALELIVDMYGWDKSVGELASNLYEARCVAISAIAKAEVA